MKFNEWLSSKREFGTTLNIPTEIVESDFDVEMFLKVKFGQREVYEPFTEMTGSEVATYINTLYNDKWIWLIKFVTETFEVGETNRKVITENNISEITGNTSGTSTNKESADNIDEFINNAQTENSGTNSGKQTGDRERNESYRSYYTSLQQMNNLDRNNVVELVLKDISDEICLKIY